MKIDRRMLNNEDFFEYAEKNGEAFFDLHELIIALSFETFMPWFEISKNCGMKLSTIINNFIK